MAFLRMVIEVWAMKERSIPIDFFKASNELAKFIVEILDKYDNHPSIY